MFVDIKERQIELILFLRQQFQIYIVNVAVIYKVKYKFALIYRVSQEECALLRESVPYVKLYRYNPKHLYPKLNVYGDNGQRSLIL